METYLRKPASAPDPVRLDRIDDSRDHCGINAVGKELRPLGHRPGNDRGSGGAEHEVENKTGKIELRVSCEQVKARAPDDPHHVFSQQQRKPDQDKDHRADTEIHQVLHQDIARVLRSGKSCLHHGETCLHPEHQRGADQEPDSKYILVNSSQQQFLIHFFTPLKIKKGAGRSQLSCVLASP